MVSICGEATGLAATRPFSVQEFSPSLLSVPGLPTASLSRWLATEAYPLTPSSAVILSCIDHDGRSFVDVYPTSQTFLVLK